MKLQNKNFLYNSIYQIFSFIIPLIITPYISRVLGADRIGIYSYTYSIVCYFMLLCLLGINNYGAREIAKCKTKEDCNYKFLRIYYLQLILGLLLFVIYLIFVCFFADRYKSIMLINSIFLLSSIVDVNWFFFGKEKFKITISRNVIIKILSLLLILIFVKAENDLWIYAMIMSVSTLISQLYLWTHLFKEIKFIYIDFEDILVILKPCLILFIPVISYSIYRIMDKTMIGFFSSTLELGYYESAEKIINIPIAFVTALGTVMMPNMAKKSEDKIIKTIYDTFELSVFMIMPMFFGLLGASTEVSNVMFGPGFDKSGTIIAILSITIVFSSISNVIRTSYLIPLKKDDIYVKSTVFGAVVNLLLNIIFIRKYGAYGACVGTISAEFLLMLYQVIKTKNEINYLLVLKLIIKYSLFSFVIFVLCILMKNIIIDTNIRLICQILISLSIYGISQRNYIIYKFLGKKRKSRPI